MSESERFYRGVNTAVGAITTGVVWYWAFRNLTARAWLLFAGANAAFWIAVSTGRDDYYLDPEDTGFQPHQVTLFAVALVLFVLCFIEVYRNGQRIALQQAQLQAQYAQQYVQAPQPTTQRTERSVTVVRAAEPPTDVQQRVTTYRPSDVRKAITEHSERRPVRHREDHGSFTIEDRRGFDPDLGQ